MLIRPLLAAFRALWSRYLPCAAATMLILISPGCGGSGDPAPPSVHLTLAGTVQPAVPDGTVVDLLRLDDHGEVVAMLGSAETRQDRFTFDLDRLDASPSATLAVRTVVPGADRALRALASTTSVAISPISEVAFRLIVDSLGTPPTTSLDGWTSDEIDDLCAGLGVLDALRNATDADVPATLLAVYDAAVGNAGLMAFIAAAAAPGETPEGPGDVGAFFRFETGNVWSFQGSVRIGDTTEGYLNTLAITGDATIGDLTGRIFHETNPDRVGHPRETIRRKDGRGITILGATDPDDTLTAHVAPYPEVRFPPRIGEAFIAYDAPNIPWADLNGDGVSEAADLLARTVAVGFESLTVTAGDFPVTLKIEQTTAVTLRLSRSADRQITVLGRVVQSRWFAPGIGPVKSERVVEIPLRPRTVFTEELLTAVIGPE